MNTVIFYQKKYKYLFVLLLFLFNSSQSQAQSQNLVVNGGFEIGAKSRFASFKKDSGYVKIAIGSQLSMGDAEIYEQANGKKSAGCFTSRNDKYYNPESIVLSLAKKLTKDQWYEITFLIKHGFGLYASNNNGIALSSKEAIRNYHILPINAIQPVNNSIAHVIIKNQEWIKCTFIYKAKGYEDVVLIGNVFYDNAPLFETIERPKDRYKDNLCLYLFDDVRIVPFEQKLKIYFNTESSLINNVEKISLDNLCTYLSTISLSKMIIKGYADDSGTDKLNNELSLKRAEEVKKYLQEKLNESVIIETQSYGATDQFNNKKLELNRLVEIDIIQ